MKRLFACLAVLAAVALLAACSATPPQTVSLAPQAKVPTGNVGKGKTVALQVSDARHGQVVGYRAADGSRTAPITVEGGDLSKVVGEEVSKTLASLGFKPAPWKEGAPLSLSVSVKELQYAAQSLTVTRKVTVKCVVSAKVVNGPGHWEGSYPVTHEKELALAPDENANARMLNDVLSESLSLLLSDPEMVQFLAK